MFFSKKIRFVTKKNNPNLGFVESDINFLMDSLNISLPKVVIEFLKKAGKKSNVLNTNYTDIIELVNLNINFKSKLIEETEEDFSLIDFNHIFCFYSYFNKIDNYEVFMFVKTDDKNLNVYGYSNDFIVDRGGWFEKSEKIGLFKYKEKTSFVDYLNEKTFQVFGDRTIIKIRDYVLLVLFFPIVLIFVIMIYLRPRN